MTLYYHYCCLLDSLPRRAHRHSRERLQHSGREIFSRVYRLTNHDKAQDLGSGGWRSNHFDSAKTGDLTRFLDKIALHCIVAESNAQKRCMTKLWDDFAQHGELFATAADRKKATSQETIFGCLNKYLSDHKRIDPLCRSHRTGSPGDSPGQAISESHRPL